MHYVKLYIGDTAHKGRGVFAGSDIEAEDVVETAPVVVMNRQDRDMLDKTLLHDYIFEWQPEGADMCCMALGWIPLYNHSYTSNCEYFMDYDSNTMYVQAVRDIKEGEEITINYSGDWNETTKVWFDAK